MSRRSIIPIVILIVVVVAVGVAVWVLSPLRRPVTGKTLSASDGSAQIAYRLRNELYVYDHATRQHIRLTRTWKRVSSADWSPDGRYLAFDYDVGIVRLDVSSGDVLELTTVSDP